MAILTTRTRSRIRRKREKLPPPPVPSAVSTPSGRPLRSVSDQTRTGLGGTELGWGRVLVRDTIIRAKVARLPGCSNTPSVSVCHCRWCMFVIAVVIAICCPRKQPAHVMQLIL